jgi:hypothetical protein
VESRTPAPKKAKKKAPSSKKKTTAKPKAPSPKKKATAKKVVAKKMHSARGLAQDRRQVSSEAKYEVAYEAKKMGVTQTAVKTAIAKVGNDRAKIEAELMKQKAAPKKAAATKSHSARGLAQARRQVSGESKYEVAYEAKKMGVTAAAVKAAIGKVGNDRAKIEARLKKSN